MLLTVDSGNTNIVFALYEGEEQRGVWRSSSDAKRTADEYAVWLNQLMSLGGLSATDVDAAIIATVVPEALFSLRSLCRSYFDCDPLVVGEPGGGARHRRAGGQPVRGRHRPPGQRRRRP